MDVPDLSDTETRVLQAVHTEGSADLYDLAQAIGVGPRAVQEAVRTLADRRGPRPPVAPPAGARRAPKRPDH
jgi:DNA-binding Lrp family transcriptional regulator